MHVAIIAKDKPGAFDLREATRARHREHLTGGTVKVTFAGPLLDDGARMIGSLVVVEVETLQQAQDWADSDPYAKAGLFQSVELHGWNKVIG